VQLINSSSKKGTRFSKDYRMNENPELGGESLRHGVLRVLGNEEQKGQKKRGMQKEVD